MVLGFSEKNHNFTVHKSTGFYLQRRDPKTISQRSFSSSHVSFFFISSIKVVSFLASLFISSLIFHCRKEQAIEPWLLIFCHCVDVFLGQVDVRLDCFLLNLKGLQLFLRCFDVSQKRPEARACWSHNSNSSSSSSIISTSRSHGNLLEFDLCVVFSKPTMFTWKLGLCVFGLHAIPFNGNEVIQVT